MNTAGRLGLYAAGLVVAFAASFAVASAVAPDSAIPDAGAPSDASGAVSENTTPTGLSLSAGGFVLSPVTAPETTGEAGTLSFRILDAEGVPVTAFETAHEKDLHLIAVRADGSAFRHEHPSLDAATGVWSMPWEWDAAGTYRVYADAVPADGDGPVVLSRTVDVAGELVPDAAAAPRATDEVGGFEVAVDGELVAGAASDLTVTVTRDGVPLTTLQPYLGAFGHLVALRDGDLAYLHVHATGAEPVSGGTAGPEIAFAVEAPTAGRYLLYLDFQVDGTVHTASFVVDAAPGAPAHDDGSHDH